MNTIQHYYLDRDGSFNIADQEAAGKIGMYRWAPPNIIRKKGIFRF
jgi:hypothetical protein